MGVCLTISSDAPHFSLTLCPFLHVYAVYVCCVHVCEGRGQYPFSTSNRVLALLLTQQLIHLDKRAGGEPQGSSCFCLPSSEVRGAHCTTTLSFRMVLGIELGSSRLQCKCFTNWATSPAQSQCFQRGKREEVSLIEEKRCSLISEAVVGFPCVKLQGNVAGPPSRLLAVAFLC